MKRFITCKFSATKRSEILREETSGLSPSASDLSNPTACAEFEAGSAAPDYCVVGVEADIRGVHNLRSSKKEPEIDIAPAMDQIFSV